MSVKNYALRIEALLCEINGSMYQKSDEILSDPYEVIVSAIEFRVSQTDFEKFKMGYQAISGQSLQKLIEENYDVEKLLKDLRNLIANINN